MSVAEVEITRKAVERGARGEQVRELAFRAALLFSVGFGFIALAVLLVDVTIDGASLISYDFLTKFPSVIFPERSGISSALQGTLYLMVLTAVFIVPVGVATAVYLEEYADRERWWNRLIEVNIQNLAAVPTIISVSYTHLTLPTNREV